MNQPFGSVGVRFLLTVLVSVSANLFAKAASNPSPQLEVGVRASVQDRTSRWARSKNKLPSEGGHGKIYGIVAVKQVESVNRLVKPVDEKKVAGLLMDQLDTHGFREFVPGQKPDILITASYGRGELTNPYIRDTGEVGGGQSITSPLSRVGDGQPMPSTPGISESSPGSDSAPPGVNITGGAPLQLFDEKGHGYEAKLQKASYEKLYIRVTAWEYPTGATADRKMLWKTIMVVDDPDHRDLNVVAATMLEAGAPYFDKEPSAKEVEVFKPLPDGRVKVGIPEVREPFSERPSK